MHGLFLVVNYIYHLIENMRREDWFQYLSESNLKRNRWETCEPFETVQIDTRRIYGNWHERLSQRKADARYEHTEMDK